MNFFRKFFPASKKNITSDTTDGICITKDTSLDKRNVSQKDNNPILAVNNIEDTTKDGSMDDIIEISDSSECLHSEDLSSSEKSVNGIKTDQKLPGFKVNNDILPEINETVEENNYERTVNTDINTLEPSIVTDGPVCNEKALDLKYLEPNTVGTDNLNIEDETLQTLKEFDEALNKYESSDNFRTEFINLDDFYEIFDTLHNVIDNNPIIDPLNNKNTNESNIEAMKDDVKIYTELKVASKTEDIDVISINSSTNDCESQNGDVNACVNSNPVEDESHSLESDGYNSSDFEFISEAEANLDGLIINYKGLNRQNSSRNISGINLDEALDPHEGPSRQSRDRNQFEDRSYRDNHHIPLGDDYLALFQGIYNPVLPMSAIFFLENKSVRASAMNYQYDGVGFVNQLALRRHQPDSSEDEFADEAKECAKQILNTYPRENRKRRRRH